MQTETVEKITTTVFQNFSPVSTGTGGYKPGRSEAALPSQPIEGTMNLSFNRYITDWGKYYKIHGTWTGEIDGVLTSVEFENDGDDCHPSRGNYYRCRLDVVCKLQELGHNVTVSRPEDAENSSWVWGAFFG